MRINTFHSFRRIVGPPMREFRKTFTLLAGLVFFSLITSAPAIAIPGAGPGGNLLSFEPGTPASYNPFTNVGFDQRLNEQLPLDLTFTDDTGKIVQLRDYF